MRRRLVLVAVLVLLGCGKSLVCALCPVGKCVEVALGVKRCANSWPPTPVCGGKSGRSCECWEQAPGQQGGEGWRYRYPCPTTTTMVASAAPASHLAMNQRTLTRCGCHTPKGVTE